MHKLQLLLLLASSFCFSQNLTLSEGSSIFIHSDSSISIDGLELAPSGDFILSGPNSISHSSKPIVVGDNSSINHVYEFSAKLSNYSGTLLLNYLDEQLNDIAESKLVLEVLDVNNVWTSVTPSRDETNNTLSYDFTESVGFTKVTASSSSATLTIKIEALNTVVSVYPNPTTETLFIVSKTPHKASLFNVSGKKLLETNAKELNVTELPSGVYLLNLQNNQNQISTFKIIKN